MRTRTWPDRSVMRRLMGLSLGGAVTVFGAAMPLAAAEQMPVTVVIARQGPVTEQVAVVGTLAAREEVQVHSAVSGQEIRQILVEVGQRVKAGQPLALLDTTDTLLALDKNAVSIARAGVAVAAEQSKVEIALVSEREALRNFERSQALQPRGAVSDQVLDEHRNTRDRAVAELALARQTLALAEADARLIDQERREIERTLERSTLRAPSAGIVLQRNARLGALASSSGEPLFLIAEDGAIEFVAEVPDTRFMRLEDEMRAKVAVPGLDRPVSGTVRLRAARLDPKTRSGQIRIALEGDEGLVPGVFARGTIDMARRSNVLLPGTAVRSSGGASSVYVVENDAVSVRSVTLGAQRDNLVEIVAGVTDGEMVVLKAGGFLRDRDRVRPVLGAVEGAPSRELSEVLLPSDATEGARR